MFEKLSRVFNYLPVQAMFIAVIGPFCFFNVQKTKLYVYTWALCLCLTRLSIQIVTSFLRWSAFFTMIGIALKGIASNKVTWLRLFGCYLTRYQGFGPGDIVPTVSSLETFDINNVRNMSGDYSASTAYCRCLRLSA